MPCAPQGVKELDDDDSMVTKAHMVILPILAVVLVQLSATNGSVWSS
jgi:hypothetical protein